MSKTTTLLLAAAGGLLWAAGFGCGEDVSERRPSELLAGGPAPRINLNITGPAADEDKRERCNRIARNNGIVLDPSAPVQGMLILADNGNRLSITMGGQPIREEPKPDWGMEQLCNDALIQLISASRSMPQGGMAAPGGYAPAPAVTVVLVGPAANNDKRERCNRIITQMGGSLDPNVAVRAVLTLADNGNNLQVVSARRGPVYTQPKPGWGMEELCRDAVTTAQQFLQQEMAGGAPPPPAYGYGQPPPPPQAYAPPPPAGGGWGFGITITGPDADEDKRERCNRVVRKYNGNPDPNGAAVMAILFLKENGNSLQVISKRRGNLLTVPKPGWGMDKLCEDAAQNAQAQLQQESAGGPPPPMGAPPPPMGAGAPPPSGAPPGTVAVSPMEPSPGAPKAIADLGKRGLADFGRRDYANALVAFAEAARAGNDPAMLFDTGLCYYMLHRPQEALQHLQLYIDRAPQAPNRPQAEALIGDLRRQLGMGDE